MSGKTDFAGKFLRNQPNRGQTVRPKVIAKGPCQGDVFKVFSGYIDLRHQHVDPRANGSFGQLHLADVGLGEEYTICNVKHRLILNEQ